MYYTVFVIDVASREVQILGSTLCPNDLFMRHVARTLTAADDGWMAGRRVLICDRDAKWSAPLRGRLGEAGIRVVQTLFQAPDANAYAEPFVRSIKHECLNRVIPVRRTPSSSDDRGVGRALPPAAESPRTRQRTHRRRARDQGRHADSPSPAPRRVAESLLSRGVMRRAAQFEGLAHK